MNENDFDPKMFFGVRVKEIRLTNNLSQEELAERAGMDRTYITSIENGGRNVSLVNIFRIARALEVSVESLFKL